MSRRFRTSPNLTGRLYVFEPHECWPDLPWLMVLRSQGMDVATPARRLSDEDTSGAGWVECELVPIAP
jgi:hypothetical protein